MLDSAPQARRSRPHVTCSQRSCYSRTGMLRGIALLLSCLAAATAHADIVAVQPPGIVAATQPLEVTLVYTQEGRGAALHRYELPKTLSVTLSTADAPAQQLALTREAGVPDVLRLGAGQFRKVRYRAPWPSQLRGAVRLQLNGFNGAISLVTLDRGQSQAAVLAQQNAASANGPQPAASVAAATAAGAPPAAATLTQAANVPAAATPASTASAAAAAVATVTALPEGRLSFDQPFYFAAGKNGDTTAKFQLSFKYRVVVPNDPLSKSLLDNLYFGYTQRSIWDLTADSKPFRDTSYMPSLFYYLPDVGLRAAWFNSLGVRAGLEHESNGASGSTSRSVNTAYVEPILTFGAPNASQLTIAPKMYYYLQKDENPDIAQYRGYTDLLIKYGRADGWQLATTLRKGTHALNGSIDAQLTYPLQRLVGGALGGFVWLGYFNGYGEDLLDYNARQHWNVRLGYSIYR